MMKYKYFVNEFRFLKICKILIEKIRSRKLKKTKVTGIFRKIIYFYKNKLFFNFK